MPRRANMRMKRKRRKRRDRMERIELSREITRFRSEDQYLRNTHLKRICHDISSQPVCVPNNQRILKILEGKETYRLH
jgi:hypothetical protein